MKNRNKITEKAKEYAENCIKYNNVSRDKFGNAHVSDNFDYEENGIKEDEIDQFDFEVKKLLKNF